MKRLTASMTCSWLLFAAFGASPAAEAGASSPVQISRREALKSRLSLAHSSRSLVVDFESDATREEVREAVEEVDGEIVESLPELGGVKLVEVEPGTADEALAELAEDPAVEIVEADTPRIPLGVSNIPNDPRFPQQWALHNTSQKHPISDPFPGFNSIAGKPDADIDAPQAWGREDGSANETVIAVLDIGADLSHPEIALNRWRNPGELTNDIIDNDGNGYINDTRGWDFQGDDATPEDEGNTADRGHGTHVAAIAAGVTNNDKGIAGACPQCKVLHLRFGLRLGQELEAIDYLIKTMESNPGLQIPILNASFGSPVWSQLERNAFEKLGQAGVLTVAAAGNAGLDNDMFDIFDFDGDGIPDDYSPLYPASYELPGILSVAASNSKDQIGYFTGCDNSRGTPRYRCMFSNWGRDSVDVAAPGTDIKSAYLGGQYRTWNGTSMAAPLVAGVAGLVKAEHPDYNVLQLKNAIMRSVDRPDSLRMVWREPGPAEVGSYLRTNGRVNALSALTTDTNSSYPQHDGMIAGAKPLQDGRNGSVLWPGDVNDVYVRTLTKGVRYAASLRANHFKRNLDLVVYKPGTQDVWQLEDACLGGAGKCHAIKPFGGLSGDGTERVEFTAGANGPHYFLVSAYFADSGYRLVVRRTS